MTGLATSAALEPRLAAHVRAHGWPGTLDALAEALGEPVATVRRHLHRTGRQHLCRERAGEVADRPPRLRVIEGGAS